MVHPVLGGANFVHFTEDLAAQFLVIFLNCVTPLKSLFTPPGGCESSLVKVLLYKRFSHENGSTEYFLFLRWGRGGWGGVVRGWGRRGEALVRAGRGGWGGRGGGGG